MVPIDPVLLDIPEWIDCPRVILAAPQAGGGAAMAAAIAESIDHLKPWMSWAPDAPSPDSAELVMRRMQADFILRRDLVFQIYAKTTTGYVSICRGNMRTQRPDIPSSIAAKYRRLSYE